MIAIDQPRHFLYGTVVAVIELMMGPKSNAAWALQLDYFL